MTSQARFPFSAVVGQGEARLALLLAAVDPGIGGVLLRGDKGSAKSTLARGLAGLLPGGAPFVELPLGATEDRVLGTLDIKAALTEGETHFRPGLLAAAHGGVLYVDEVNLLPDHLVDVLLDVAASGVNQVERDGVSHSHPARFVLVGSMNPEEGELRPQLLDRFGLSVEIKAPNDPLQRAEVVRRRLTHDAGGHVGASEGDILLRARLAASMPADLPDTVVDFACRLAVSVGAEGLRADLVLCRGAAAFAGWEGRSVATAADVERVAPVTLGHRRRRRPFDPPTLSESELERALEAARRSFADAYRKPEPPEAPTPAGDDAGDAAGRADAAAQGSDGDHEPAEEPAGDADGAARSPWAGLGGHLDDDERGAPGDRADDDEPSWWAAGQPGEAGRDAAGGGAGEDAGATEGDEGGEGTGEDDETTAGHSASEGGSDERAPDDTGDATDDDAAGADDAGGHVDDPAGEGDDGGPPGGSGPHGPPAAPTAPTGTWQSLAGGAFDTAHPPVEVADPAEPVHPADAPPASADPGGAEARLGRTTVTAPHRGRVVGDQAPGDRMVGGVALAATVRAAAQRRQADPDGPMVTADDLREPVRARTVGRTVVVVVDASGSMGTHRRVEAATGAVLGLLADAYLRRDRVAMVTFRADAAEVVLPPTASVELARTRLAELPTGGVTPLAEGIAAGLSLARRAAADGWPPLLVLITDGRATGNQSALDRARAAAAEVAGAELDVLVIDAEDGPNRLGLAADLATAMNARHLRLDEMSSSGVETAVRDALR
ncbi:MAG TPA: ATP-binding protein [Acidimicrobiales bacterium]